MEYFPNSNKEQEVPVLAEGIKAVPLPEVIKDQTGIFTDLQRAIVKTEQEIRSQLKNEPDFIAGVSVEEKKEAEEIVADLLKDSTVTVSKPQSGIELGEELPPIAILDCSVTGLGIKRLDDALNIKMKHFDAVLMAYMLWLSNSDKVKWKDFKNSVHIFGLGDFPQFGDGFKAVFLTGSKFNPFAIKEADYGFDPDNKEERDYAVKFISNGLLWVREWLEKANKKDADIPWVGGSCGGFQLMCAGAGGTGKKEKAYFGVYDVNALPEMENQSSDLANRFARAGGKIPVVHGNTYILDNLDNSGVKPIAEYENRKVAAVGLGKGKGFLFAGHPELPIEIIEGLLKEEKWGPAISKMFLGGNLESSSQVGRHFEKKVFSIGEARSVLDKMAENLKPTTQSHLILRSAYGDINK